MNQLKRLIAANETRIVLIIALLVFFVLIGFCFAAWHAGEDVSMRGAAVGGGLVALFQYFRRQKRA